MPKDLKQQIAKRVDAFVARIEASNIQADEIPEIVDAGLGVVENVVASAKDGRLSLREVSAIWTSLDRFFDVVKAARKD
jgi:hypothetical protein